MKDAQNAGSLEKIQSARMVFERLREEFPEVPAYREELAVVLTFLGRLERGKAGQADLERALSLANELADRFPNIPKYQMLPADVCRALAENRLWDKDAARAESFARKSVEPLDVLKAALSQGTGIPQCRPRAGFLPMGQSPVRGNRAGPLGR